RAGLLDVLQQTLRQNNIQYAVYSEIEPNPSIEMIEEGVHLAKEKGSNILVAVGGGSAIDAAKAISIMLTHEGELAHYEGLNKLNAHCTPIIAIPTTAGTGSEVTFWTVITDNDKKAKFSIGSQFIAPKVALVDPEMTRTLPASITSSTGID